MNHCILESKAGLFFIILGILACSLSAPASQPGEIEPATSTQVLPSATVENAQGSGPHLTSSIEMAERDPCLLMTKDLAESVLGQPVDDPILASDSFVASCTYIAIPGEKFATVAVYEGDSAKNHLLNEIAQLQAGCELSITTGEQPATFPPEIEAQRAQSMLDLFKQNLALKEGCWGGQGFFYEQMDTLGANAYTYETFLQGAVIGVATDDAYLTFLVADVNATSEQALEAARELVIGASDQ